MIGDTIPRDISNRKQMTVVGNGEYEYELALNVQYRR